MDRGSPDGSSQRLLADREDERADRLAYEQLKVRYSLSLADAWIAAAAQQVGATLMHKDPGFRAIANLPQEWLG